MEKKNEQEKCPPKVVAVDGGFSQWSAWTECAPKSEDRPNDEFKTRNRECNNPVPANGGNNCDALGPKTEQEKCPPKAIDGGFSEWSAWTVCGENDEFKTRNRECNAPAPANGGKDCEGLKKETQACRPKPIDGGFSEWSAWTECGENDIFQDRNRECNNPAPANGGKDCDGLKKETQDCPPKPIDGGFSAWSEWTKCAEGDKVQSRNRECNNPKPNFGGKNCDALGKKIEEKECPKPPTWTPWGEWSECSVTCGSGTQSRSRTCPVKDACPGLPSETKGCEKDACDSVVRCPKDMTYLDAKQFCASRGMKLPRPYSMAENERMTKLGATWMEVIVNEIFGLDERFENWKGRQRGFLCPDGEWQFKRDDRSYYGPFTRHSLDEIQLGSKLQYKCKGKKQCRGFVCVRTGDGNSAFVRCKGPNCKNWFNRKPFDFNKCSLACASGYRTLKCY